SLGGFVLSGGETAAMAVIDAVCRRLPGALGNVESLERESFSPALDGRVEHLHFSRPAEFRGWPVPEVLLSGDHAAVARWRDEQSKPPPGPAGAPRRQ
ncbi:MAG: tRNA (guanosine(37)-N1)-methyltransferase TrmD, partial [Thermoleophilia bacterium]|nr:tRNA (guanosine(37)-N1)-methyltransferase TrmD [Thermoleophilia bacterium]